MIAGAREVPHNAILRVTPGTSAFGPYQLLKNRLTREVVAVPAARTKWVLAFHDHFGFIHEQGEASIWVSTLLVHSVWETEFGEQFVATRVDSGEGRHNMTSQWMQEWQQRRYPRWLSWEADAQCPALPVAKANNVNASVVEGSLIFWQIHDFQVHTHMLCQGRTWVAKNSAKWQAAMRLRFGVDLDHWQMRQLVGGGRPPLQQHLIVRLHSRAIVFVAAVGMQVREQGRPTLAAQVPPALVRCCLSVRDLLHLTQGE